MNLPRVEPHKHRNLLLAREVELEVAKRTKKRRRCRERLHLLSFLRAPMSAGTTCLVSKVPRKD